MREKVYDDGDVTIFQDGSRFFIRYDAGSHQIAMREDEIGEGEAALAMKGSSEVSQVLFALQKRLKEAGVNPYVSNTK